MNAKEAAAYGRQTRKRARELAEMGDVAPWVAGAKAVDWWLGEKSHRLGIVGPNGLINMTGEVAQAFRAGYLGRKS